MLVARGRTEATEHYYPVSMHRGEMLLLLEGEDTETFNEIKMYMYWSLKHVWTAPEG